MANAKVEDIKIDENSEIIEDTVENVTNIEETNDSEVDVIESTNDVSEESENDEIKVEDEAESVKEPIKTVENESKIDESTKVSENSTSNNYKLGDCINPNKLVRVYSNDLTNKYSLHIEKLYVLDESIVNGRIGVCDKCNQPIGWVKLNELG